MADREALKTELERVAADNGHAAGPWLEVGHAAQLGCLACDQYGFLQLMPPPPRVLAQGLGSPCPDRSGRLINTPE